MRQETLSTLSTPMPSYPDLKNVVLSVYGSDVANRLGYRTQVRLRHGVKVNSTELDRLLPLAHLFVFNPKIFRQIVTKWSSSIRSHRPSNSFYTSGYRFDQGQQYRPDDLLGYLHRAFGENLTPSDFNVSVARLLGCPDDVSEAMTTQRTQSPTNLPILPLATFHLKIPASHYVLARDIFDVYTSRLLINVQEDVLHKYLLPESYRWAVTNFRDNGLDDSLVLGWQIVRSMIRNMSMKDTLELVAAGVEPMSVLSVWVTGLDISLVKPMLLNGIDEDLALSLAGITHTHQGVEHDAEPYLPWVELWANSELLTGVAHATKRAAVMTKP